MAKPKYQSKIVPDSKAFATWAPEIRARALELDRVKLMPWQNDAAKLIGELRAPTKEETKLYGDMVKEGVPKRKTVIVTVPRQSGKTTVSRSSIDAKARRMDSQEFYSTAQTRIHAARHLEKLGRNLHEIDPWVKATFGVGNERVTWDNGTKLQVVAPNQEGGHGDTADLVLIDEAWTLIRALLGGLRPALATRPLSQMLLISTMGTIESEVWNDLVEYGREESTNPSSSVGYIEYSAPNESMVFDESKWHLWMPALGRTITKDTVREDLKIMPPEEFVRAYGNLTVTTLQVVFPGEWVAKAWRTITPPSQMVLAVDVNDDPAGASIVSGHMTDKGVATRLVEWRYGSPTWAIDSLAQIMDKRKVDIVVSDLKGPTRQIAHDLTELCETKQIPLVDRMPMDFAADTVAFYDALREQQVFMEKTMEIVQAFEAAKRKDLGDLWVVRRKAMTADASPLNATILAHGQAKIVSVLPPVSELIHF